MNKINLAIATLFLSNLSQAGDLGKLRDKIKEESANLKVETKKLEDKAQAWGEHMKSRNAEDIKEIEARFKEIVGNVDRSVDQAVVDVEAEAKRVTATLEKDWEAYKERRKQEEALANPPGLSDADKVVAGERVYAKLDVVVFAGAGANSFETFVKSYETALQQESLSVADAAYVKSTSTGDTLLHSLVKQAYALELENIRDKQISQRKPQVPGAVPSIEYDVAYKQTLLAISYFSETTSMGSIKNKVGKLPVDIVLEGAPMSFVLAQHLVVHDMTNASKNKFNELFPAQ